jgi:hypothetical protein
MLLSRKIFKEIDLELLYGAIDLVIERAGNDVIVHVVDFIFALLDKRPIVLPHITPAFKPFGDSLLYESNEFKHGKELLFRYLPWLFHVPLGNYKKVPWYFPRIAQQYIGMLILFKYSL